MTSYNQKYTKSDWWGSEASEEDNKFLASVGVMVEGSEHGTVPLGDNERNAHKYHSESHIGSVELEPGEAVCDITFLTYNRHLGRSPYIEWSEKKGGWVQAW